MTRQIMPITPTELTKTSHSEVESYLKCERNHYYGYGLKLKGKRISDALARGIAGHAALAAYYGYLKTGTDLKEAKSLAFQSIYQTFTDMEVYDRAALQLEVCMLIDDYITNYGDRDLTLEVLEVEKEFQIPVGDNFFIKMIVDMIVRMPNGAGIAVWDHKFVYDFYAPDTEDLNPQLPKYLGALRSEGWNVTKAYYNEVRYRKTSGTVSDPSSKFKLTPVDISTERVIRTFQEQIIAARRIRALRSLPIDVWEQRVLRVANQMTCRSCSFKDICIEDLNGISNVLSLEFNYGTNNSDPNN
jgi:hypothetical protein